MAKSLRVNIIGDPSSFTRALDKSAGALGGFGSKLAGVAKVGALAAGAAGLGGLALTLRQGIDEFGQSSRVAAQTEAVLKSTGGAANVTAGQVDKLAQSLMNKTGIDDEAVKTGENMLLTFTNVRNEVGAGNDIFNQATQAVTDMATAMNGGAIPSSEQLAKQAILVGKALNDPVRGATSLRRVGVSLTEQQQKQIKAFVKSGDTMKAQKMIVHELTKEFGGSAEAIGKTLPGKIAILRENFNNLAGDLVGTFAPAFEKAVSAADKFLQKFDDAKGFHAKLNVVIDAVEGLGRSIEQKIGSAIASVDWAVVWGRARGVAAGLQKSIEGIDWAVVGSTIGSNFSAAVDKAISATNGLPTALKRSFDSIDWNSLGRTMGPGLAAAVVSAFVALTDPGFWIKNWDLALAVGLTVFGGAVGKVAGRLGEALGRLLGPAFERGILAIASALERVSPRLGEAVLNGLMRLPALVLSLLSKLVQPVTAVFNKLGGLAKFVVKVIGLDVAINAVVSFAEKVIDWFKSLPGKVTAALGDLSTLLYDAGVSLITGFLAGIKSLIPDVKETLKHLTHKLTDWKGPPDYDRTILTRSGQLVIEGFIAGLESRYKATEKSLKGFGSSLAISTDIQQAARLIGLKQAESIAAGFVQGTPSLQQQIKTSLAQAMTAARQAIAEQRKTLASDFGSLAQGILQAFDDKAAAWQSPASKLLAKMQIEDTATQLQQQFEQAQADVTAAQSAVATAGASADAADVAQAQQQLLQAQQSFAAAGRAITENDLAQQDIAQTAAHAATEAKQRESLARRLITLQTELAKHPQEYDKVERQVLATLKKYEVPMFAAGQRIASRFGDGLRSQLAEVNKAASALAKAVADHLVTHSPAKKGPLSAMSPQQMGARIGEGFNAGLAGALYAGRGLAGYAAATVTASSVSSQASQRPTLYVAPGAVVVHGYVGDERQLAATIRDSLVRLGQSEGGNLLGGYA
jgi:hypothetical protein